MQERLKIFFTWLIMWACDIVPGVSGGTVAFISGIYEKLLWSLRLCLDKETLMCVARGKISTAWERVDGTFLLLLFSGIAVSILSLASVLDSAIHSHPQLVRWFFFGLVVGSIILLLRQQGSIKPIHILNLILWAVVAFWLTQLSPTTIEPTWWMIILSAMIAICAMILPGISWSFLLLMMWMYTHVIGAIESRDLVFIWLFWIGAVLWLGLFSRVLSNLLKNHHTTMIMVLIWCMVWALPKLRPRQNASETMLDRHGEEKVIKADLVLPAEYTGDNEIAFVFLLFVLGIFWSLWIFALGEWKEK